MGHVDALTFAAVTGSWDAFYHSLGVQAMLNSLPVLLYGTWITVKLSFFSVAIGTLIGLFIGLFKMSKNPIVKTIANAYVDFFRGTPLLVQVFLWYFGILPLFLDNINPFMAAIIACSVNCGAYVAEIVRGGIQAIDKGQTEAAMSLGLSYRQTMQYVVLPQAFKVMIPPLLNEFIAILKDTSLVSVIAVEELVRKAQLEIAVNYQSFPLWTEVAILYLCLTLPLTKLGNVLERRLGTK